MKWYAVALALLTPFGSAAVAQDMPNSHSSKGYTVHFPSDWRLLDQQGLKSLNNTIKSVAPSSGNPNLDVMLYKSSAFDYSVNMNIIVVNDEMPINQESRDVMKAMPKKIATVIHARVDNIVVRDEKFNGYPALAMQYDMNVMGKKMTTYQVGIPKAGRTYIITCTAPADDFRTHEPTFRLIMSSFELSAMASMPRWLLWGLIGAGISLFLGILGKMMKSSN